MAMKENFLTPVTNKFMNVSSERMVNEGNMYNRK